LPCTPSLKFSNISSREISDVFRDLSIGKTVYDILFRHKDLPFRLEKSTFEPLGRAIIAWLVARAFDLAGAAPLAAASISKG
jgi:hypothetical protein